MSIQRKIFGLIFFFLLGCNALLSQNKRLISGIIIDVKTKEPLPYVTVSLKKQLIGIVTNEEGKFDLYIPAETINDTLFVNYLGYKHFLIDILQINGPLTIALEETVVQLEEIVIRPLFPENYILMAMRKIKENYPKEPFQSVAYYREKTLENKNLIKSDEGVFKTFYPSYIDSSQTQHQLMLFRRGDSLHKMTFMARETENKLKKDSVNGANGKESKVTLDVGDTFGGPADILKSSNITKKQEAFLDTLQLKKYKYSFAKSSSYNTDELMVIDFSSRGKVNHVREEGKLYIDLVSLAIVKIEVSGALIIPAIVKPLFFFLSIGIKNPKFQKKSEFQLVDGKWHPKNIQNTIAIILTNNHLFRKDERSEFEIEQFFTVNALNTQNVSEIALEKRFKEGKEMQKQVFNDDGLKWEGLNIIKK